MTHFWRRLFPGPARAESRIPLINQRRAELGKLSDDELKTAGRSAADLLEVIAVTAVVAARVLQLDMFDVQIQGALALVDGKIAEMQTGEGKTVAAVPAIVWYAKAGQGVHVMTVNDYLARRDAKWMGPIYDFLGLTVGYVQQSSSTEERRKAYACDITYATPNEIGFDHLRDGLAMYPEEQVHRPFAAAVIDEADSILIDEARIPLVIAGGKEDQEPLAYRVDRVTRHLHRHQHFTLDEYERNIALTDAGIRAVEHAFGCGNLFAEENLPLLTAVQDSLHARELLDRDVDYLVKDGAIESVDEFKGRIAQNRRWPAGIHTAIEAKEGLALKTQGRILGSVTLQNLIGLYPKVCGMTGTAATQMDEFRMIYGLEVEVIPTNRPVIRVDYPDELFNSKREKEQAVIEEIGRVHATGQPVLVGTRSVEESERLSGRLRRIEHQVLNARHEEQEAGMIARAGERNAVTISTNMAGRGTDIRLGQGVAELGGLHVIGTNRHESRRIDNQLRGRAGRQGDPGSSQFFVSAEDPLAAKYGGDDRTMTFDQMQRIAEGQNLDIRLFLRKYESVIEGQRQKIGAYRQTVLSQDEKDLRGRSETGTGEHDLRGHFTLAVIDELWADYLAAVAELRSGTTWVSLGYGRPLTGYLRQVDAMFREMEATIPVEVAERLERNDAAEIAAAGQRGATWTYLTTDEPFGPMTERIMRQIVKVAKRPANLINAITRRQ